MNNQSGQSLFEVMIALAISAIIIIALVALVSSATRNAVFSKNQTEASRFAQEAVEWLRQERDTDIATFKTHAATTTWCLSSLDWTKNRSCGDGDTIPDTPFSRQVKFEFEISSKTIIVTDVVVSWEDGQGFHEVAASTNFTDWRER